MGPEFKEAEKRRKCPGSAQEFSQKRTRAPKPEVHFYGGIGKVALGSPVMENFKSQFIEARNRSKLDDFMLSKGYVPYHPVLDTGVDVIYYREDINRVLKVQLKSRATLDKKYVGRGITVAYPSGDGWVLYDHDALLDFALDLHIDPNAAGWAEKGIRHWGKTPSWMADYFLANDLGSDL